MHHVAVIVVENRLAIARGGIELVATAKTERNEA